jgi:hypothetical protein
MRTTLTCLTIVGACAAFTVPQRPPVLTTQRRCSSHQVVPLAVEHHCFHVTPQRHRSGAMVLSAAGIPSRGLSLAAIGNALVKTVRSIILTSLAIVLSSLPALAATRRAGSSFFSSNIVKYGVVGVIMIAGSMFSKAPPPTLVETTTEDGSEPISERPESLEAESSQIAGAAGAAQEDPLAVLEDDGMLFSSLAGRMQALAEERRNAEKAEDDQDAPANDSTDGWGEGSTAVLEPPKPGANPTSQGVLDGEAGLDFPTGFPLIDGEVVEMDTAPASLSEDDLAKFKRMMGNIE